VKTAARPELQTYCTVAMMQTAARKLRRFPVPGSPVTVPKLRRRTMAESSVVTAMTEPLKATVLGFCRYGRDVYAPSAAPTSAAASPP
jgi:hypothetical protein